MLENLTVIAVPAGIITVFVIGIAVMVARLYRQVEQGRVLIVNTLKAEPKVTFTGAVVIPIIHRAEVMDMSLKTIEIDRRGKEGLICQDNIRADIKVSFFVRVNKTREDVLKVAQSVGCVRASDENTLQELFAAKFAEALKSVGKRLNFEQLYAERENFKDQIIQVIGKDLNGYMLEDVAIDYLEQTHLDMLDPHNILDSQGIRKITEMTTQQNIRTNEARQTERKEITKQNVEADEAVFSLERQRAEAAAKQKREIETIQARELAETEKVKQEEALKAQLARIRAEEEMYVNEQNKQRQIEVAEKNRERVVGIETERVQKDRNLEAISREREVELQRIAKEKALEVERKAIADVVSTRIAVEKKVAAEEELIKDLRVTAEARRKKDATVINAEAQAQELVIKDIKAAEAAEEVARHAAKQRLIEAEAALEAADKEAKAKQRLAEGIQAEEAAHGLAQARVKEADAAAEEKRGMVAVRVREADAQAIEKQGIAQATILREKATAEAQGIEAKLLAEARGKEQQGLAVTKVQLAEAEAIQKRGLAESVAIKEKLTAEAQGLAEKASAMKDLDGVGKDHEEFRLRLGMERDVQLEQIRIRQAVAAEQAKVMAEAFKNAKINIVGGDGQFFDQFMKAVTLGNSVDGAVGNSDVLKTFLKDYLNGNESLPKDLKDILAKPGMSNEAQNLRDGRAAQPARQQSGGARRGPQERRGEVAEGGEVGRRARRPVTLSGVEG